MRFYQHREIPGRGELGVLNRSYYEDMLVVRVHNLAPRPIGERRFAQINDFERMLTEEGTTIITFFLYKHLKQPLDDSPRQSSQPL